MEPLRHPDRPALAAVGAVLDDIAPWRPYAAACARHALEAERVAALRTVVDRLSVAGLWPDVVPVDTLVLFDARTVLAVASLGVEQARAAHALAAACVLPWPPVSPRPVRWTIARGADDAVDWWQRSAPLPCSLDERELARMGFGLRVILGRATEGPWVEVVQPDVDVRALPPLLGTIIDAESLDVGAPRG